MDFIEVALETAEEGLELVSGLLYSYGLTGLMIEDEQEFQAFLENPNRDWDYVDEELVKEKKGSGTNITFFVSNNASGLEQLEAIKGGLKQLKERESVFDLGSLHLAMKNCREEDWANNWKKYFKPFAVGERLIIKPSWEELEGVDSNKTVLNIDPGHIFGTGTHETTQLCIELIEKYIRQKDIVLDIGCGSGILSIASFLLGAEEADALDIDPNAVEIAYENADRNSIDRKKYHVKAGNILEDTMLQQEHASKQYDLVEANIVADVIIALSVMVPAYLKEGGVFVASGIITDRLADVESALKEHGFQILDILRKKDWVAIAARH